MFSEYELIGQSNNLFKKEKQKPILFLRFGLDGVLNKSQKFIAILLGYVHVTYEHSHPNKKSFVLGNKPVGIIVDDIEAINIDRPIDFEFAQFVKKNQL